MYQKPFFLYFENWHSAFSQQKIDIILDNIRSGPQIFVNHPAFRPAWKWKSPKNTLSMYVLTYISMTSLLTHTVAHSTRPSFRPKTINQPLKKSTFYVKIIRIFLKKNFIEEYHFRDTLNVIEIFWKLQFLYHYIF